MFTFALPFIASTVISNAKPNASLMAMATDTTSQVVRPRPTPRPLPTLRPRPTKPPHKKLGAIAWNTQYAAITADSLQLTLKEGVFGKNISNLVVSSYPIFNGPAGSVVDRIQVLAQWEESGKEIWLYFTLVIVDSKAPVRVWKATAVDVHIHYYKDPSIVQYNTQAMIYERNPLVTAEAGKPWTSRLFTVAQDNGYPTMNLVMRNVRITGFLNDPQYMSMQ